MKLQLEKFGKTLISRELGSEAFKAFTPTLRELPKEEERTRGIKIEDWYLYETDNKQIAHIWDFGGQDVYYPVLQKQIIWCYIRVMLLLIFGIN